jgi:hypothetical protein
MVRIRDLVAMMRVIDLLEEMAPELLRINPGAAETAALAMLRIRSKVDLIREDLGA